MSTGKFLDIYRKEMYNVSRISYARGGLCNQAESKSITILTLKLDMGNANVRSSIFKTFI